MQKANENVLRTHQHPRGSKDAAETSDRAVPGKEEVAKMATSWGKKEILSR